MRCCVRLQRDDDYLDRDIRPFATDERECGAGVQLHVVCDLKLLVECVIRAMILICQISQGDCTIWTAERREEVEVPKTYCMQAAMQYVAQNMSLTVQNRIVVMCDHSVAQ